MIYVGIDIAKDKHDCVIVNVLNPLHTNLYRKGINLRKTKTDKVDAHHIALMIMSKQFLKSYANLSYPNENLKSLPRYRFNLVEHRGKLKASIARLAHVLFPELENLVSTLYLKAVYALLKAYPSATHIANAHLTKLTNLVSESSKGRFTKDFSIKLRKSAQGLVFNILNACLLAGH